MRRLTALEVQLVDVAAGASLLALLAAPARLAETAADAAPDALFGVARAGAAEQGGTGCRS